jgi:hypothetical protein
VGGGDILKIILPTGARHYGAVHAANDDGAPMCGAHIASTRWVIAACDDASRVTCWPCRRLIGTAPGLACEAEAHDKWEERLKRWVAAAAKTQP